MIEHTRYRSRLLTEYEQLAPRYESRWANYLDHSHKLAESILPVAGLEQEHGWLDVACGTGLWLAQLRKKTLSPLFGLDLNIDMLVHALAKEIPDAHFLCASAESLPLRDSSFDGLSCLNALHYFIKAEQVLDEFARVLKPGAPVLIVDWCADYWFQSHVLPHLLRFSGHAHAKTWNSKDLRNALEARGFVIETTERLRFSPIWDLMGILALKR